MKHIIRLGNRWLLTALTFSSDFNYISFASQERKEWRIDSARFEGTYINILFRYWTIGKVQFSGSDELVCASSWNSLSDWSRPCTNEPFTLAASYSVLIDTTFTSNKLYYFYGFLLPSLQTWSKFHLLWVPIYGRSLKGYFLFFVWKNCSSCELLFAWFFYIRVWLENECVWLLLRQ